MIMTTTTVYTPSSERELIQRIPGDIIKISYAGDRRMESDLAVYWGLFEGTDFFDIAQRAQDSRSEGIRVHQSPRRTHQYDQNLGVILSAHHRQVTLLRPQDTGFNLRRERLEQAEMWK